MKLEFKRGDIVHWQTYEGDLIKAKVIEAKFDNRTSFGRYKRIYYEIEGVSKPLQTSSTPRLIKESVCFVDGDDAEYFDKKTRTMRFHFKHAPNELKSCEHCTANENGHYCLINSVQIKNANIYNCKDWTNQ